MEHSDFNIGTEFLTETGRWRCTDVGIRTIAAIKLDLDHDPGWYNGPPYAIVEHVFDEYDLEACEPAPPETTFDDIGKHRLVTRERRSRLKSPFSRILAIDYTVIFVRDMTAMRRFYEAVLGFPVAKRTLGKLDRVQGR